MRGNAVYHCMQVFVTAQGRCIELAKCLVQGNSVLLLVSPGSGQALVGRLNKYILYGDEVSDGSSIAKESKHPAQFEMPKFWLPCMQQSSRAYPAFVDMQAPQANFHDDLRLFVYKRETH